MNKLYTTFGVIGAFFFLVSSSNNPSDGKTGGPGEGLCVECHSQSNTSLSGTISIENFPSTITPGEKYVLTVANRNTVGDGVIGGFQVTILGPLNTKAGTMANPSDSSAIANSMGRQYFEHRPARIYPDSNVIKWTVEWTAPQLAGGSKISWYAAGVVGNGNSKETDDRVILGTGFGEIVLSGTEDVKAQEAKLFPNPGSEHISLSWPDETLSDGICLFFDLHGRSIGKAEMKNGQINVPDLLPGMYLLEVKQGDKSHFFRWCRI